MAQSAEDFLGDASAAPSADTFLDAPPLAKSPNALAQGDINDPYSTMQGGISPASARAIGAGVEEGAKKFWAGIHQLGASIADVAQDFWKPEGNTPAERAANWEKRSKAVTSAENIREANQAAKDQSAGIDLQERNIVAGAAQVLPWMIGPEMAAARLPAAAESGYFGNITKQVALGIAQQGTTFSAAPSKLSDIAIGAVAQTVAPAVGGALAGAKNFVANKIQAALKDGNTEKAFQLAKDVLGPEWADGVSLARRTGIPWLASMESASNDSKIVQNYANSADTTVAKVAEVLRQPIPEGQGLEGAFMSMRASMTGVLNQSAATRNALWDNGMAAFKGAAGDASLALPTFGAKVKELDAANNNLLLNPGKYNISAGAEAAINDFKKAIFPSIDPAVAKADAQLQTLIDTTQNPATKAALTKQLSTGGGPPKPQIKLADAGDALTGLRKMQADPDPKVQALARQLRDSFETDLTTATTQGDPQTLKALTDLKSMRAEYGRQAQLEDRMKNGATATLLGAGQGLDQAVMPSTEDMWNKFKGLPAARQASVVDFMEANNPSALVHLKQKSVDDAVASAGTISAARDSQQSLGQLTTALFDKETGMVVRNPGLWSPAEMQKLNGIKAGLSVLANTNPKATSGSAPSVGAIVGYAYNKAAAVAAKSLLRVMAGGIGSEVFTRPDLIEKIMTVGKTTGIKQDMARIALAQYMSQTYGPVIGQDQ